MEMIVLWTDSAIEDIQQIYDYYNIIAGDKVANKITNSIIDKVVLLEKNPRIGQLEDLLKHKKEEIRYLVIGNYKLVYFIEKNQVIIASVFDCRQDPLKLFDKSI
jgi:plasmid stabilization system protein ParE